MSGNEVIFSHTNEQWLCAPRGLLTENVKYGPTINDSFEEEYLTTSSSESESESEKEGNSSFLFATENFLWSKRKQKVMQLRNRKLRDSKKCARTSLTRSTAGYSSEEEFLEAMGVRPVKKTKEDPESDDDMPELVDDDSDDEKKSEDITGYTNPQFEKEEEETQEEEKKKEEKEVATFKEIKPSSADASFGSEKPDAQVTEEDFPEVLSKNPSVGVAARTSAAATAPVYRNQSNPTFIAILPFIGLLIALAFMLFFCQDC